MSAAWANNFSGSHNVYFDFPPVMQDGRNYSNWQAGAAVNEGIRKSNGIRSNWEYRQYLTHHADHIIKTNMMDAANEAGHAPFTQNAEQREQRNVPFMYASVSDQRKPFGYEDSDLKSIYLSRNELQARMIAPSISQDQLKNFH